MAVYIKSARKEKGGQAATTANFILDGSAWETAKERKREHTDMKKSEKKTG